MLLLDTNICVALMKNRYPSVTEKFLAYDPSEIAVSSVTLFELEYGAARSLWPEKNRNLVQKLDYISRRTTREKLLTYLSEEAKKQNTASITIPFNRQQLADYLSVDRSAMSNELCKMRDEGLLEFERNRFKLL